MLRDIAALLFIFLLLSITGLIAYEGSYLEAKISYLNITPSCGFLSLKTEKGILSMVISYDQAIALRDALNGTKYPRPSTHDIAAELAKLCKAKALYINKLVNGTYYAVLKTSCGNIDIRPSDGLIICSKIGCKVYVNPKLII